MSAFGGKIKQKYRKYRQENLPSFWAVRRTISTNLVARDIGGAGDTGVPGYPGETAQLLSSSSTAAHPQEARDLFPSLTLGFAYSV